MGFITIDYVINNALESVNFEVVNNEDIQNAIDDVTSTIQQHLGRDILKGTYTQYITDWEYNSAREAYTYIPDNYPIISADTDFDGIYLVSQSQKKKVEYTAGYVGPEQTGDGEKLPNVFRRVCFNLVMYELISATDRMIQYDSVEKNIGGVTSTLRKSTGIYERELKKLQGWQRLV